jgi:hypothetical protein
MCPKFQFLITRVVNGGTILRSKELLKSKVESYFHTFGFEL